MIYCLTGQLIYHDALSGTIVVDCAGVGYKVTVTNNTFSELPLNGDKPNVRIFTHLQLREDGIELFGFYTLDELEAFKLLISVSGVGPKAAMSILSLMTPEKLAFAVSCEDTKAISRAPGVGAKTAARVVLELKDKLAKAFPQASDQHDQGKPIKASSVGASQNRGKLNDARDALAVLGYSSSEVTAALSKCDLELPLEDIIKNALAALLSQ